MTDPDITKTQGYLRLALPLMAKHDIPTTPANYDIWYQYVAGENTELVKKIDTYLQSKETFTNEINNKLYQQFCAISGNKEEIKRLREELHRVIETVMVEFSAMTGKTEKYSDVLNNSATLLSDDASPETINRVLDKILVETKNISRYSQDVQQQLLHTTSELKNLQEEFEQTKQEASVDFLTGLGNRKSLMEILERMIRNIAEETPLGIMVIDIDHFKKFNDTHGHLVGDEVIKFVAKTIIDNVRGKDFIARYGGEEFIVLLPQTPIEGTKFLAEKIRKFFEKARLKTADKSKSLGQITVSIGAAIYRDGESMESFIDRGDKALYHAKNTGRNKVVTEKDLGETN